jgi:hypothetical protein
LNDELPSLEEQGITQLYSLSGLDTESGSGNHADRAFILKRIAKSLLLNFLELVGVMSVNPEQVFTFPLPSSPFFPSSQSKTKWKYADRGPNSTQRKSKISAPYSSISTIC